MKNLIVSLLLVGVLFSPVLAQDQSELATLDSKFSHHLETKFPGWKHERGEPMMNTANVLIEFWSFSNRRVKITIAPHHSAQEAKEIVRSFLKYNSEKEEIKGLGDEAYSWGYGSNIVFARGRFIVYVSTYAEVDSDPDARSLSPSEKGEREKSEMRRLNREFAKHILTAIDLP